MPEAIKLYISSVQPEYVLGCSRPGLNSKTNTFMSVDVEVSTRSNENHNNRVTMRGQKHTEKEWMLECMAKFSSVKLVANVTILLV